MSYLLGYQKWRKLHESAKYGKLYEQAFDKSPAQFVIIGGTDPTPINDATLHTETGIPDGKGIALYEISIKDALNNNFSVATKVKDLAMGSKNEQDQFQIVDANGVPVSGLQMAGQAKSVTFTYTPKSTYKIRFSGNGVLAMHRAALELKSLKDSVSALSTDRHTGHIRLYMNHSKNPVPLSSASSGRLGIAATSLAALLDVKELGAKLLTNCFASAIHHILADEYKEPLRASFREGFSNQYVNSLSNTAKSYSEETLDDNKLSLFGGIGESFVKTGSPYTGLDQFKGQSPTGLLKPAGDYPDTAPLPKRDSKGNRDVMLKLKFLTPIKEYVKLCLENFAKDGSTIDTYFKLKLKGVDDDLVGTLTPLVKNMYRNHLKNFDQVWDNVRTKAWCQLYLDKAVGEKGTPTPGSAVKAPKGETEYESGKSGTGGTKTSAPTPQVGPNTPLTPPAPEKK